MTLSNRFDVGESSPVKVRFSFTKTIWTHYSPQVIKVAGQPVHRVTKHCVAFADEALHGLQLGTLCILAEGFVSKCFVQGQPFKLADLVLIQGADAQVADLLAFGRLARSSGPRCPNRLSNLRHYLYDNPERDSITTLFRCASDVGLGYTPKRLLVLPPGHTLVHECSRLRSIRG